MPPFLATLIILGGPPFWEGMPNSILGCDLMTGKAPAGGSMGTAKVVIFPAGDLADVEVFLRLGVVFLCVGSFYLFNKNLVYPTVLSAIILTTLIRII